MLMLFIVCCCCCFQVACWGLAYSPCFVMLCSVSIALEEIVCFFVYCVTTVVCILLDFPD